MLSAPKLVAVFSVVLVACLAQASALANTSHHHVGGGSSGGGTDADCLRWGFVTADGAADGSADADGSVTADAGDVADAGAVDASPPSDGGAGMVCLERVALFRCDLAGTGGAATWPSWLLSAAVLGLGLLRRRSARRRKHSR